MRDAGRILGGILLIVLGLGGLAAPGGAADLFPASELQEARLLRQRVLEGVPGLELRPEQAEAGPVAERAAAAEQQLLGLEGREGSNPFFHWARGELRRQGGDAEGAEAAYQRAARAAADRPVVHWVLWQEHLARGLDRAAGRHERRLEELSLRLGSPGAPLVVRGLNRAAGDALEAGEAERAILLYDRSLEYAPGSPEALAGRAQARFAASGLLSFGALGDLARGLTGILDDSLAGRGMGANFLLSLLVAWLACLPAAALVLGIKHHDLWLHELAEGPLRPFPPGARRSLGLLFLLFPLALGLGLLWEGLLLLLLLAPCLGRRSRVGVSLLLLGLVAMPTAYGWIASRHLLAASPRAALVRAVEGGERGDGLVARLGGWLAEGGRSGLAAYSLGTLLKRRGELAKAEVALAAAVEFEPGWSAAHVGLGNLRFLTGRLAEAEASYLKAAALRDSFAASANLGALYAGQVQLDKSTRALAASQRLDPHLASALARAGASGGPPIVLDEPIPEAALGRMLGVQAAGGWRVAEGLWGGPLRGVPLGWLPGVGLLALGLFWGQVRLRGGRGALRCPECGSPFCARCQPDFKERTYCPACAPVYRQRDGIPAVVKLARFREADGRVRRENRRAAWLGGLIPGGGGLYREEWWGLPVCLAVCWLLAEGLVLDLLAPSLRFPGGGGSLRAGVAVVAAGLLHGLAAWWGRRGPAARPRAERGRLLRGGGQEEAGGEAGAYLPADLGG